MPNEVESPRTAVDYAQRLLEYLEKNKDGLSPMLIMPHDYPDPDAMASAFGLQYLLSERFGVSSRIVYGGVVGRTENRAMVATLQIPVRKIRPTDLKRHRSVALVDTQASFQNNSFPSNRVPTIVIDQHVSSTPPSGDLVLVDPDCGATCVIIAQAMLLAKLSIPASVATAVAYGILSDTLDLYRAKRPDVVQTYLSILPKADMRALAHIQIPLRSRQFFVTLGRGIRRAVLYRGLLVSHLGGIENPDAVSEAAEFLLTYKNANWTLCTGRYKSRLHVSLRTVKRSINAGEVLRDAFENRTEAGGHGSIAGGSFKVGSRESEETWRAAETALQLRLQKRLRIASKADFREVFA